MYCKYCGKQIDDDSSFCAFCGEDLTKTSEKQSIEQNNNKAQATDAESDKHSSLWGLWLALPFVVLFVVVFALIVSNASDSNINNLSSADYTYKTSQDLTSYIITVTPNKNIDRCDIELILYDHNGEKIFSDTISKTNLKRDSAYAYKFEFGFVNSLTGSQVKFNITGKR